MSTLGSEDYMRRCLELASLGAGKVSPNPMVGAVVVKEGRIIAEGFHQKYGGPHAEAAALSTLSPALAEGTDVYVSLEPCCHQGKTPPCTELLISKKVKHVIYATGDPNPLVSGRGAQRLEAMGIKVTTGVLKPEAEFLNRRFFTFVIKQRPWVILKWAQSHDGFLGRKGERTQLTSQLSVRLSHKWRTEEDGIMAGAATIITDNPLLTARAWPGRNPHRFILDSRSDLPRNLNVFNNEASTYVIDTGKFKNLSPDSVVRNILSELYSRKIQSVIVEGGQKTLELFINSGCWDEARVFTAEAWLGKGIQAPAFSGTLVSETPSGTDLLSYFRNPDA